MDESGSSVPASMTCRGSPRGWADVGRTAITRSVLAASTAPAYLGSLLDRQPGMPAVGIPKRRGFPQVRAGCAACCCFWLNDSEEVRLDRHAMDVELIMKTIGGDGLPKVN